MKIGYALIAISIICKGFFIDNQSFCKNAYRPTQFQLLYTVNFASFVISFLALVLKQQLHLAYNYCMQHREITWDIIQFSGLSVLGQILIYYVGCNDQLQQNMLPLISMSRKLLSMLLSLILSHRSLNVGMAIGLVIVFGSLVYELID